MGSGGLEKSPAAICGKIALAENGDAIEGCGDGLQTRSYCFIDDCVEVIYRLGRSELRDPLNLGTDRLVAINELVYIVARIARNTIYRTHNFNMPLEVRGRNSDNERLRTVLGWEPATKLEGGLAVTNNDWIRSELARTAL